MPTTHHLLQCPPHSAGRTIQPALGRASRSPQRKGAAPQHCCPHSHPCAPCPNPMLRPGPCAEHKGPAQYASTKLHWGQQLMPLSMPVTCFYLVKGCPITSKPGQRDVPTERYAEVYLPCPPLCSIRPAGWPQPDLQIDALIAVLHHQCTAIALQLRCRDTWAGCCWDHLHGNCDALRCTGTRCPQPYCKR